MWLPAHFAVLPLCFLLILLLALRSRHWHAQRRLLLLRVLFVTVLCSELIKQVLGVCLGAYSPTYLPFHYSTTYYVSLGLYAFGSARARHYGHCTLLVGGALLFLCMLLNPLGVVGDPARIPTSFFALHSLLYHLVTLQATAIMLANGDYHPLPFDTARYLSFLFLWAGIAFPAARLTNTNYAGLLSSYLPALEQVRLALGNGVYLAVYGLLAAFFALGLLRLYAAYARRACVLCKRDAPAGNKN